MSLDKKENCGNTKTKDCTGYIVAVFSESGSLIGCRAFGSEEDFGSCIEEYCSCGYDCVSIRNIAVIREKRLWYPGIEKE